MGSDAMILVFWMLSFKPAFYSPLSPSSRGSWVLHFLPFSVFISALIFVISFLLITLDFDQNLDTLDKVIQIICEIFLVSWGRHVLWASFLELLLVHSVDFGVLYFCFHLSLDLIFLFWFLHWPTSCLVACCLFFKFYVYYFWLHWIFVAMCRLSLVVASRGCFLTAVPWLLLWWLLLLASTGSRVCRLQ